MLKIFKVIVFGLLCYVLFSCKKESTETSSTDNEGPTQDEVTAREDLEDRKGELYILVEGAVDSWLFYHLHDYRSYEPLIRSTEYNADEDYYIHKCRYRASTLEGGYETEEKIFVVRLELDSIGLQNFKVEDITGTKSLTEKDQ